MSRADKLNSLLLIETTYYSISLQSHCTLGGLCKEPKLHYTSGMESGACLERQEQKQGKIKFPSFDFSGFPLSLWQGCGSCSALSSPSVKVVLQALGCAADLTEQPQALEMEILIQDITVQENPGEYNLL